MKWLKHLFKGYDKYVLTIPKGFKGIDGTHVKSGYVRSYQFVGYPNAIVNSTDPNHKPFVCEPVTSTLPNQAVIIESPCEGVSARLFAKYIASCCNKHYEFKVEIRGIE